MTGTDYCDLCDLPRSQCVHGRPPSPPSPPPPAAKAPPKPRRATPARRSPAPATPVTRRWTSPEELRPFVVSVLEEAGGELGSDELFGRLEDRAAGLLRPGDRDTTPEGEPRWQYAARRARQSLIKEGLMTKAGPGVWKLA